MGASLIAVLTCKEVSRMIASDELKTNSWLGCLEARFHLMMCRHCRRYSRQIQALGSAVRRTLGGNDLDQDSRGRLRESILRRLSRPEEDPDSQV